MHPTRSLLLSIAIFSSFPLWAAKKQPNVVILFTDDQGSIDANCYGSKDLYTPNIDKLAETGVRFTQAYAHTVCCPARAMLLTGRHPQRSGVHHWTQGNMMSPNKGINMALEEVTLAEALKPAGYRTALFGKWHLGAHRDYGPKKQGFDEFFGIRDGFIDNYNHYFLHGTGFHDLYEGTTPVKAPGKYFPEMMVERSLEFIDRNKEKPFFLYVPFNIPHYPEQSLKMFEEKYEGMKDEARRSYGAIVSTTDHYVGQILDKLEEHGLYEDTLVIFMSDNGHSEETGNRIRVDNHKSGYEKGHFYGASGGGSTGKWVGRKGQFLEGGIRVPTIISYPAKLPKGAVRGQAITAMDWMPTILDLCGVQKPDVEFDGYNILPILKSDCAKSQYKTMHWAWGTLWAVREGDWKLIGNKDKPHGLHNLAGEKPEQPNLIQKETAIKDRLFALHKEWVKEVTP